MARLVAKRWENDEKTRILRSGGLFSHRQLFLRTVKTLPKKVELVSSRHTNSKNCSTGFNGAIGTVVLEKRRKMAYCLTYQYYRELCNNGKTLLHLPEPCKVV